MFSLNDYRFIEQKKKFKKDNNLIKDVLQKNSIKLMEEYIKKFIIKLTNTIK